jgi:hypothetical protein
MMEYLILGIMEYWAGNGKKSFLIVLFSLNPTFQYSIIPLFPDQGRNRADRYVQAQWVIGIGSRQAGYFFALTLNQLESIAFLCKVTDLHAFCES